MSPLSLSLPVETPWPKPARAECHFYHAIDLPGGETIESVEWDLRGLFDQYVGDVSLAGKSVLDVGTASGFLAFSAERKGATVTAIDCRDAFDRDVVPFAGTGRYGDPAEWHEANSLDLVRLKNSFWYAWHALGSGVRVAYLPMRELARIDERFDIVIAGAIIEHLSDPVSALGAMGRAAREKVILPFTPLARGWGMKMSPLNRWRMPQHDYVWCALTRGLYEAVFANLGFRVEFKPCRAVCTIGGVRREWTRPTIVATRVSGTPLPRAPSFRERLRSLIR